MKIESAAVSVQANGLHLYSVFRNIQISSINIWQTIFGLLWIIYASFFN